NRPTRRSDAGRRRSSACAPGLRRSRGGLRTGRRPGREDVAGTDRAAAVHRHRDGRRPILPVAAAETLRRNGGGRMTLSLEGVEVSLAGAVVVRDVDLVLAEGEIVGLVGPNGSGKSTLLRSMYRALRPSAG